MINKVKIFLDLKIYIFSLNFGKKKLLKNLKNNKSRSNYVLRNICHLLFIKKNKN